MCENGEKISNQSNGEKAAGENHIACA